MKRIMKPAAIMAVMLLTVALYGQSKEFKTGKSLDIQFSVLRELSLFYVDSVEIDKLVKKGTEAMLEALDPYTVYIPEENEEDLEMMTTGSYGGIGSIITKREGGIELSEVYENSPAHKAGLVAGDMLLRVDTAQTKYLSLDQCSARMKGVPGTTVSFLIKRLRTGIEEEISVLRERIHMPDVPYWGMISDTIGYIRITGFTVDGWKDVKNALVELKKNPELKRLVLDLRGNGGGLLDEAVNIVSLFVPSGTKVVSALGRFKQTDAVYFTKEEPVDLKLPLIVMVNSGSASSSEIVAGALQDLDRATIVGTRTFGKGLIQSIRDVGYNTKLKLTTAKYYTPSGRCVQAIDYSNRNEDGSVGYVADSLIKPFKTRLGRTVYDGGGIVPDVTISPRMYSRIAVSLIYADILRDYSVQYYKNNNSIGSVREFFLTDEAYNEFVDYAEGREFDHRTSSEVEFDKMVETAKREGLFEDFGDSIKDIESKVKLGKRGALIKNKEELKSLLEEEICSRYYFQRGRFEKMATNDEQLTKAVSVELIKTE
ncbi:MAG: S41 family peptidase [Bacteroidales bacterium]|jgi:carboxyl-terminal processing protease|nr:S41 family peptidase [Bacteroidales bacterium]MDD4058276.1 S41 family peptidase [Bacteroidales bacterium]